MASKSKSKSAGTQAKNKKQVKADAKTKTARASKGTKKVQAAPQPEEDTVKLPGKTAIQRLSTDFLAASDRASTLAGKAGEIISEAVKRIHLNAREFKRAHGLKTLGLRDPHKLAVALRDFDYYRDCLELDKLAGDDLFDAASHRSSDAEDDEGEETSGEADDASESDNVERIDEHRDNRAAVA